MIKTNTDTCSSKELANIALFQEAWMEYIRSKPIKYFDSIAEFLFKHVDLSRYKIQITESGGRKFPKMCFEIWTKEIDKPEELVFHLMVPKEEDRDLVIVVLPTKVCKLTEYVGKIL